MSNTVAGELLKVAKVLMAVSEGDICSVDMRVIKEEDSRRGMGMGHWMKVVKDTVKMGDGQVKVVKIRGSDAEIVADSPMGAVMGGATVPVKALKMASSRVAVDDTRVLLDAERRLRGIVGELARVDSDLVSLQRQFQGDVLRETLAAARSGLRGVESLVEEARGDCERRASRL